MKITLKERLRLLWYNTVQRHINDIRWRKEWNRHPEWLEDWKVQFPNDKFHPGMLRSSKISDKAYLYGKQLAKEMEAEQKNDNNS